MILDKLCDLHKIHKPNSNKITFEKGKRVLDLSLCSDSLIRLFNKQMSYKSQLVTTNQQLIHLMEPFK